MTQSAIFTGSGRWIRRRGGSSAEARLVAALLVLLVALPFTAPFSTCSVSVLFSALPGASAGVVATTPVLAAATDDGRGYPLQSVEEQMKDATTTGISLVAVPHATALEAPASSPSDLRTSHHQFGVLRI